MGFETLKMQNNNLNSFETELRSCSILTISDKKCFKKNADLAVQPIGNNSRRSDSDSSHNRSRSHSRRRIIGSPFGKIKYRVLVISAWLLVAAAAAAAGWSWSELLRWLRDWHCSHAFMSSIRPANPARPSQSRPEQARASQALLYVCMHASSPSRRPHRMLVAVRCSLCWWTSSWHSGWG